MPVLTIRSEGTGAAWTVWPLAERPPPGAIQETGSYLFELRDAPAAGGADLLVDYRPLEALRTRAPDTARWRWSPGFHAGTVEAELRLPGSNPRRFEIVTDPDLRKLTREDFAAMVREILEDTFALFALSSFRTGIARGSGIRPPALARLEFLRSRIDELETVVDRIARDPRRMLTVQERLGPYYRAVRATGPEILKSLRTGKACREASGQARLPLALKGFLPELIHLRQRRSSLDLPEHRQIGACLWSWAAWLAVVAETLGRTDPAADPQVRQERAGWADRCRHLARRLSRFAQEAPFAESGDAPPRLLLSAVFRNDPVYRRFFRLWQDMNLGLANVFGDFLNMPLARTFELYELWCFLRLLRAAGEEYGSTGLDISNLFPRDSTGSVTIPSGAVLVPIGGDRTLYFQKQYREYWIEPDGRGSFSRAMIPDIVLAGRAGAAPGRELIVLDAKYRIESGLNDALNSIHTYRDALVRESETDRPEGIVKAAYVLTPYLADIRTDYRATDLPARLFHPEYRRTFRFGAVMMRPGMSADNLRACLRTIVDDAGGGE
jgi:hypothetical protein